MPSYITLFLSPSAFPNTSLPGSHFFPFVVFTVSPPLGRAALSPITNSLKLSSSAWLAHKRSRRVSGVEWLHHLLINWSEFRFSNWNCLSINTLNVYWGKWMIQTIKKVGKLDGIKSGTKGRSEGAELQTNKKERKSQVEVSLSLSLCASLSLSPPSPISTCFYCFPTTDISTQIHSNQHRVTKCCFSKVSTVTSTSDNIYTW